MRFTRILIRVVRSVIGRLVDLHMSRDGKQQIISFSTEEKFAEAFDELYPHEVNVEIKRHYRKRSLDANKYCWKLIDLIAEKTSRKKTDIYLEEIKEIGGISGCVAVKDEFVPAYIEAWKKDHIGRDAWVLNEKGKPGWSIVKVRLGSSDFDSHQMSLLISAVIQDAEALGIPTITDEEAEKMLGKWAVKSEQVNHAG